MIRSRVWSILLRVNSINWWNRSIDRCMLISMLVRCCWVMRTRMRMLRRLSLVKNNQNRINLCQLSISILSKTRKWVMELRRFYWIHGQGKADDNRYLRLVEPIKRTVRQTSYNLWPTKIIKNNHVKGFLHRRQLHRQSIQSVQKFVRELVKRIL